MTTLIYKKLLNNYIIDSSFESEGDGVTIELSEPVDGKLTLCNDIHRVKAGVCLIKNISDGKITPKLYTGMGVIELEGFVYRNGVAVVCRDHNALIIEMLKAIDGMITRLSAAEAELVELNKKVSRRISLGGYDDTENKN